MELFEQWFHMSPDGGSGLLETLYAVMVLLTASALGFRKLSRIWSRNRDV
jgi:hypothetical protein